MTGLFIVFEGVEGCGKSTQAQMLAERLAASHIAHRLTRDPGGTAIGEQIRGIWIDGVDMPKETELLLVLGARAAHVHEVLQPALARGEVVICDRYELSSFAYQGVGRGLGVEVVRSLNRFATGGLKPDLTIIIDVPVALGEARRAASRPASDRIERAGDDFHTKVAGAYRLLAEQEDKIVLVDGTPAPEAVQQAVNVLLQERFPETFDLVTG